MEESKDCNVDIDIDILVRRRRKRRKICGEGEYLFFWRKRKPEKEKEGNIWRRSLKDIEKSRFRFRSRNFCQFLEGFGIGFGEFGLRKKVSVLVLENLVSEKKSRFRFRRIWSRKKVSVSVLENLVSEKKSWYRFRSKFWYRHSVALILISYLQCFLLILLLLYHC